MKVAVFALGRTGLPLSMVCADSGFKVVGIDINENIVQQLKEGKAPFYEPGMQELLDKHLGSNFIPTSVVDEQAADADYLVIAIGTKFSRFPEKASLTNLYKVTDQIKSIGIRGKTIIFRVTLPVGTTDKVRDIFEETGLKEGKDFYMAFVPERLVEGSAIEEEKHLPKVIGCYCNTSFEKTEAFFKKVGGDIVRVSAPRVAEAIKMVDNSWRNTNFAFANEVAALADTNGLNVMEVLRAANFGYERNHIPVPGPVSGYCLGKDPYLLEMAFEKVIVRGFNSVWFYARRANDWLCKEVVKEVKGQKVLVAGLAFKENIDDFRNGHPLDILEMLISEGYEVSVHDPFIDQNTYTKLPEFMEKSVQKVTLEEGLKEAETVIFTTAHNTYREMDILGALKTSRENIRVLDLWNIFEGLLENAPAVDYYGLGRGDLR